MPTPPQQVDPLFQALRARSIGAHRRIRDGLKHGVDQQETTITDTLLLELKRRVPGIIIHTLTQREEGVRGADWEWWWQGRDRWFAMLVQAKRLRRKTPGTFGYDLAYRTAGKGPRQVDILLQDAQARGRTAIYVLYNGPEVDMPAQWRCDLLPRRRDIMGASFLPASIVAHLLKLGSTGQCVIRSYDAPLPCLVCPRTDQTCWDLLSWWPGPRNEPSRRQLIRSLGFPDRTPHDDLALRTATSCLVGMLRFRMGQFRRLEMPEGVAEDIRRGVFAEPPDYVAQLAEQRGGAEATIDGVDLGENPPHHVVVQLANGSSHDGT